jgi:hypothetical protein
VIPDGLASEMVVFNVPEAQLSTTMVACATPAAASSAEVMETIFFMMCCLLLSGRFTARRRFAGLKRPYPRKIGSKNWNGDIGLWEMLKRVNQFF